MKQPDSGAWSPYLVGALVLFGWLEKKGHKSMGILHENLCTVCTGIRFFPDRQ